MHGIAVIVVNVDAANADVVNPLPAGQPGGQPFFWRFALGNFVLPRVFRAGYTVADLTGLRAYLEYTGQTDFLQSWDAAIAEGVSEAECLMSLYAKLCYKSLVADGRNANITRTRDIPDNIKNVIQTAHGSVFEHACVNFIVTDCSRIYTHEQCRHRQGWAYSQTSGRFCRLDTIDLILDPILDPVKDLISTHLKMTEDVIYLMECKLGMRKPPETKPNAAMEDYFRFRDLDTSGEGGKKAEAARWVPDNTFDFTKRKKLTSAIRRIAPNGQSNEIGMSVNLRALRHTLMLRTARHAEWEIRLIYGQIYSLVKEKFPLMFADAKEEQVDGLLEISGMKTQPYEIEAGHPDALRFYDVSALEAEVVRRGGLSGGVAK